MKTRRFLVVLPLAVASGLVASCGDDDVPNPPPDAAADVANDVVVPPDTGTDADAKADAPLAFGQVDRAGRAAIVSALVTAAYKDGYNAGDSFTFANGIDASTIGSEFQRSLVELDLLDMSNDWDGGDPGGGTTQVPVDAAAPDGATMTVPVYPHPLVSVFRNDLILVDTALPFSPSGYLEIENAVLKAGPRSSCGGRWLADDAVDKTLSFIIKGTLTGVSDNVAKATKDPTETFPYLAPPN